MSSKIAKVIVIDNNTTLTITTSGLVYFNDYLLTQIPKNVDISKLEQEIKQDEKLHRLINDFFSFEKIKEILQKKQDEIREIIKKELIKAKKEKLQKFHYDKDCYGMFVIIRPNKVIFRGNNLVLETINKDYNFSCFLAQFNRVIRNFTPNLKVKIVDDGYYLSISVNDTYLVISDKVTLNQVLTYLSKLKDSGKFINTLNMISNVVEIERHKMRAYSLFKEIQHSVKEIAKKCEVN